MRNRLFFVLLLICVMRIGEASQGLWQGDMTYDVMVWHGYQLSCLQLRVADKIVLPIVSSDVNCVVAKGWKCFFETEQVGSRKIKPVELRDLKLQQVCGTNAIPHFNVWLDFLFYGYKNKRSSLLLGALPLSLYPSNILPAVDEMQRWIKNKDERHLHDLEEKVGISNVLPWPICGDTKTSSPKVIFDKELMEHMPTLKCEFMEVNAIDNEGCGDNNFPTSIKLLNADSSGKPLDYYRIKNVREWVMSSKITIGKVGFEKKDTVPFGGSVNVTKCRLAICDKHKELRRLYIEFELTSPDLFKIDYPGLKVETTDGKKTNSLIFFVGIQVQPRNASEICIDDEWLEDEEEDSSL